MWHTIAFVADSRHLDAKALADFALAHEERYGIATDRAEPEVNTWHVDKLVADFKATDRPHSVSMCKCLSHQPVCGCIDIDAPV
jgi:hypothetical protein